MARRQGLLCRDLKLVEEEGVRVRVSGRRVVLVEASGRAREGEHDMPYLGGAAATGQGDLGVQLSRSPRPEVSTVRLRGGGGGNGGGGAVEEGCFGFGGLEMAPAREETAINGGGEMKRRARRSFWGPQVSVSGEWGGIMGFRPRS